MTQTARTSRLRQVAKQFPAANQQIAQGYQAARDFQLQQATAQAPTGAGAKQAAQQAGAGVAALAGQQAVGEEERQRAAGIQIAQQGLQQTGREGRARVAEREFGLSETQRKIQDRLFRLNREAAAEIFSAEQDLQMRLAQRKGMNERNLVDWAVTQAKSEEDWANWSQQAQQTHQRKLQMLEIAQKKVEQALQQGYLSEKQKLDQDSKREITKMLAAAKKAQQKAQAEAANKTAMWKAAGTVVGAAGGAAIGFVATGMNPMGAVYGGTAGASVGAGAGTALSGT